MHRPTIEQLLIALASAGEASYTSMITQQQQQQPHVPAEEDVGELTYVKYQEFWVNIGQQVGLSVMSTYVCMLFTVLENLCPITLFDSLSIQFCFLIYNTITRSAV